MLKKFRKCVASLTGLVATVSSPSFVALMIPGKVGSIRRNCSDETVELQKD